MPHASNKSVATRTLSIDDEPVARSRKYLLRPVILTAGAAIYWALYRAPWVFPGISILHATFVFTALAGYTLGFVSGSTASVAALILHVVILRQAGYDTLSSMWLTAPAAHFGAALTGPLLGRLRRTERRARREMRRRRSFEAQLRSSEAQYRMIVERMTEGVVQCANDDTILYANRQFCAMTGYSLDELEGLPAWSALFVDAAPGNAERWAGQRRREHSESVRVPLRRANGDTIWCQMNEAPIRDDENNVMGWVATVTDISEQVRTEDRFARERQALRESESRFRELADNVDVIFWIRSVTTGRMVYISPAFDSIFARPRMAMYADPKALLHFVHVEDRERVERALQLPGTSEYELEYRIVRPDGEVRWLRSRAFPVHGDAASEQRVAGLISDITTQHHSTTLAAARGRVMGALADGSDLKGVLESARKACEDAIPGADVVVFVRDDTQPVPPAAGSSVPDELVDAITDSGFTASAQSSAGSCARIVMENVESDPRTERWKDTFAASGIRACWWEPLPHERVDDPGDEPAGAIIVLFRVARPPRPAESTVLQTIASLVRIAVSRYRTREALRSHEDLLRLFIEHSPAAIAMFDTQARYLAASRRWLNDYGIEQRPIEGLPRDDVCPDTPVRWKRVHAACLADHVSRSGEDLMERRPGVTDWVRWEVKPWFHRDGTAGGVTMGTEIITGQRQAREQLKRSEARYRFLIDRLPDALTEIDVSGNILFATRDFPGRTRREIVGTSIFEHVGVDLREPLRKALDEAARTRNARDITATFTGARPNQSWEHRVIPIADSGVVIKFLVISTDVSARHQAESALKQSEVRYRRHFENDASAAFIESPNGALLACNASFAKMLEFESVAQAQAVNTQSLFPNLRARAQFVRSIQKARSLDHVEIELKTHKGKPVHVIANIVGEFDESGNLARIYGYLVDDTARHRLEQQLHQAQKMEAIGRLAGGIAHDFNNMLTTIAGYAEMLQGKTTDGSDPRRYADEILGASDRASALTRRLLEFSRKDVLEPRAIHLNRVIGSMEAMLERTIGENISLEVCTDPHVGQIVSTPGMIENVLLNLALNARDAMLEGGQLRISTSVEQVAPDEEAGVPLPPGNYAVVTVTDTGVGMDDETQLRIFEPFFTTKEQGRGTGLGLATVYGAVHQCGGHVRVSSRPGEGATFRLYFSMTHSGIPGSRGKRRLVLGPSSGNETVLIAEDETAVQRLTRDVLELKGYNVLVADDGMEALRVAEEHIGTIGLLVTDLVMPRLNGRELAARLRESNPRIKVLYISGYIGRTGVRVAELGPRTSFLSKPFSPQSFARKVRLLLDVDRYHRPTLAEIARRRTRETRGSGRTEPFRPPAR